MKKIIFAVLGLMIFLGGFAYSQNSDADLEMLKKYMPNKEQVDKAAAERIEYLKNEVKNMSAAEKEEFKNSFKENEISYKKHFEERLARASFSKEEEAEARRSFERAMKFIRENNAKLFKEIGLE